MIEKNIAVKRKFNFQQFQRLLMLLLLVMLRILMYRMFSYKRGRRA